MICEPTYGQWRRKADTAIAEIKDVKEMLRAVRQQPRTGTYGLTERDMYAITKIETQK